jgi:hypothetical protein
MGKGSSRFYPPTTNWLASTNDFLVAHEILEIIKREHPNAFIREPEWGWESAPYGYSIMEPT